MEKIIVAEHWKKGPIQEPESETFTRCKSCNGKNFYNSTCVISIKYNDQHQIVDITKKRENIKLKAPISAYIEERDIVANFRIDQEVRVEVTAVTLENAIIQENIKNREMQENLIELGNKLKGREVVEIYTDRAMINQEDGKKKMRIGQIAKTENRLDSNISFSSSIENWPSSTHAELGAIWTALLAIPIETQVHIFTDSKAAIEAIEKYNNINKLRNHFKTKNRSLLSQIRSCYKAKSLDLRLHKVKGYSGNIGNNLVDKLAKRGLSSVSSLNILEFGTEEIDFIPEWKDQSIDSPLRAFVNITSTVYYETEWSRLSKMADILKQDYADSSNEKLTWNNMWQALKKLQGKKCISLKKSKTLIFRIKCINNILPTKDICFQRNPKLYKSPRCIACFKYDETLYHIAECEIYQKIWKNLEEEAIQLTGLEVLSRHDISLNTNLLKEAIFGKQRNTNLYNRRLLLRGFTNIKQQKEITKITGSKRKANLILINFIDCFWNFKFKLENFYNRKDKNFLEPINIDNIKDANSTNNQAVNPDDNNTSVSSSSTRDHV